jgi:hypothetical protein
MPGSPGTKPRRQPEAGSQNTDGPHSPHMTAESLARPMRVGNGRLGAAICAIRAAVRRLGETSSPPMVLIGPRQCSPGPHPVRPGGASPHGPPRRPVVGRSPFHVKQTPSPAPGRFGCRAISASGGLEAQSAQVPGVVALALRSPRRPRGVVDSSPPRPACPAELWGFAASGPTSSQGLRRSRPSRAGIARHLRQCPTAPRS